MLRSIAFVVVFLLAGGPELSLTCKSWCASGDLASASCHHHEGSAARFTHNRSCLEDSLGAATFVTKELNRAPQPSGAFALVTNTLHFVGAHAALILHNGHYQSAVFEYPNLTVLRL